VTWAPRADWRCAHGADLALLGKSGCATYGQDGPRAALVLKRNCTHITEWFEGRGGFNQPDVQPPTEGDRGDHPGPAWLTRPELRRGALLQLGILTDAPNSGFPLPSSYSLALPRGVTPILRHGRRRDDDCTVPDPVFAAD
jgi:hypothetical protein